MELAIRRDLLTKRQYGRYDVTFDRGALIRSDVKSLHEALARPRDAGIYTANDIRRKFGENPLPADQGDVLLVNGNMVPVTQVGHVCDPRESFFVVIGLNHTNTSIRAVCREWLSRIAHPHPTAQSLQSQPAGQ